MGRSLHYSLFVTMEFASGALLSQMIRVVK